MQLIFCISHGAVKKPVADISAITFIKQRKIYLCENMSLLYPSDMYVFMNAWIYKKMNEIFNRKLLNKLDPDSSCVTIT